MIDQPNTETDAEFVERFCKGLPYEGSSGVDMSDNDHMRASELLRRAVAPAPAVDVEQRVSDEKLAELVKTAELQLKHVRWKVEADAILDLRDARAALAAMPSDYWCRCDIPIQAENDTSLCDRCRRKLIAALPSDRQRGLLEAADIAVNVGAYGAAKAIRTAAAQLGEPDDGWRDIASAPKDGSNIWLGNSSNIRVGFWSVDTWVDLARSEASGGPRGLLFNPTHWRPLPLAPSVPR